MNNGIEVFAKLPNPIAGPAFYTTASEVATREFLRDVLHIPTPRILAWSADRNNPAGTEYILEERAPGKPLGSLWYQWPMKPKLDIISQISKFEQQLTSTKFVKSGCIYFREDMPSGNALETKPPLTPPVRDRFRLGPLVSQRLWRGERASLDFDRGPYDQPLDFVGAMAKNEMKFIKANGRPRMNYHRSITARELPEEAISLLERYLQVSPYLVPPCGEEDTHSPTLWHPDLHLDNVYVDPTSKQITCIIDWQGTAAMPLYYQYAIPRMFQHPGSVEDGWAVSELPEGYESLCQSEKGKIDRNRESEICHKFYESQTFISNPRCQAVIRLDHLKERTAPTRLAVGVWEDRDVFFLRQALISIAELWPVLCPDSGQCPIGFSEQELFLHAHEGENTEGVGAILKVFRDKWSLPVDGMVDPAEFHQMQSAIADFRNVFLDSAESVTERNLFAKLWPYQEPDNQETCAGFPRTANSVRG